MLNFIMLALVLLFGRTVTPQEITLAIVNEAERTPDNAEPKRPEQPQGSYG